MLSNTEQLENIGIISWISDGVDFEILDIVETTDIYISFLIRASRDGEDLYLDNPYVFVNPPIDVVIDGEVIIDPELALKNMIEETVLSVANREMIEPIAPVEL